MKENTSEGRSVRSSGERLTNTGKGQVGYRGRPFRFRDDGVDIPCTAMCVAKARRMEKEKGYKIVRAD